MLDRIKPEYQGRYNLYLLKDNSKDKENAYPIATLGSLKEINNFFLGIIQSPSSYILRTISGVRDLQADDKFMSVWSQRDFPSDAEAINSLEKLILQN